MKADVAMPREGGRPPSGALLKPVPLVTMAPLRLARVGASGAFRAE